MEDQQQGAIGQNPNGQNTNGNGQNPRGESFGYHTHDASVVQYRMNNAGGAAEFDDNFPPGYRFKPQDSELVVYYLRGKIFNEPLPPNRINEVNLYKFNPDTLAEKHKPLGQNEWYFFTPRDKKYKNGKRPNRAAADGYWKATGADKRIEKDNVLLGFKKALVFYMGKPPRGDKTDWIMHEFRLEGSPMIRSSSNDMRLDDWVLCRIYKKRNHDTSRSRLLPQIPSTSQLDSSGLDDQQSDTEFQDNGAVDMGVEGSSMLPKGSFMPQGPGGSGVIDMSNGYSNQGGFFNSYDNTFLYHQNQFGNHNVPYIYSDGGLPALPDHNVSYAQGRLNPGMPNHNGPYSQGMLNPGMPINNVSYSQGRLPGVAHFSFNNPMWQSNSWTHMIPTSNQNPNQAAESSSAAATRSFQSTEGNPDEYLNDPYQENCFDPDVHNSQKF